MNSTQKSFVLLLTLLSIFSHAETKPEKENIAVIELLGELTKAESSALTGKVINEILKSDKYMVFERSQMDEILKEQGFQQTGCTSTECAIEIGQLLGVRKIVFGNIGKVGELYTVSLKIVNIETGAIEISTSLDVEGTIEDILRAGIETSVKQLLGKLPSSMLLKGSGDRGIKLKTTFAVISLVAGVGSGGAGIYFWSEKSKNYNKYLDATVQKDMDNYKGKANSAFTSAVVLTSISGVCIPTSIVLFILRGKDKKDSPVSIIPIVHPDCYAVSFSYHF